MYKRWFLSLKDVQARAKINVRLRRIELAGQLVGDFKSVGDSVIELRFDSGPGYRVYITQVESAIVVLLAGGDKSSQVKDIVAAKRIAAEWRGEHGYGN